MSDGSGSVASMAQYFDREVRMSRAVEYGKNQADGKQTIAQSDRTDGEKNNKTLTARSPRAMIRFPLQD
jgi:hypothetical protein